MKIAVFTDNPYMASSFYVIYKIKKISHTLDFYCSMYSKVSSFSDLNIVKVDIKSEFIKFINNYDLIFSVHSKQIFPKILVRKVRCVNIHPGYNPINRGWYPQVFSIIYNLETGATIHEMDEYLDHGPIIAREIVHKESWDTSLSLYNKIVAKELALLEKHLLSIVNYSYKTILLNDEGKVYLKKDFNNLLNIDLNKKATYGEVINHLRALSHGDFKNAYFYDEESKQKIYLNLKLIREYD